MASLRRRPIYRNPGARSWRAPPATTSPELVSAFHRKLPDYSPTRLISLPKVAKEIGVKAVYLKYEGWRLGLSSFKILGASWGTFRALASKFNLPLDSDLTTLKKALVGAPTTLFTATDGNHGLAVARMGSILETQVHIFVPSSMNPTTIQTIKDEGALITQINGSYDLAVQVAFETAKDKGILIQDTAFPGYEEIPSWITDGYRTMLHEIDEELDKQTPDWIIAPVGVGSFAQAVVAHYKELDANSSKVLTVEPDTAACLYKSLIKGKPVVVETTPTIMAGLDCGTVSSIAWPLHKAGVDASLTVSDYEVHVANEYLKSEQISTGPCGASPLAALRRFKGSAEALELDESSIIVLLCTEGNRPYEVPKDVSFDDAQSLAQTLVQIDSSIPAGGGTEAHRGGPGVVEITRYVTAWLEHRDIETQWLETLPGRPSVVGIVRGTGNGKSLMLNGHLDTATMASDGGDPSRGQIKNGRLYGRGAADAKGGVAASLVALARAKQDRLDGDIIFTGVAGLGIGTEQLLQAGWRADGAIVSSPTQASLGIAHKGFACFEVTIHGRASPGFQFDTGIDAISRAGYFLVALDKYSKRLIEEGPKHPSLGPGSVHASIVKGGEDLSSYPATCSIQLERRTVLDEPPDRLKADVDELLKTSTQDSPALSYESKTTLSRPTFEIAPDHPFVSLVADQIKQTTGKEAKMSAEAFWTDASLLAEKDIAVVMYGPIGETPSPQAPKEGWVDLQSLTMVAETLIGISQAFCGEQRRMRQ